MMFIFRMCTAKMIIPYKCAPQRFAVTFLLFLTLRFGISPAVGEDPLSDSECDLDSVAGVLKLYFRNLEPPLYPYDSYPQLLECVRKSPIYKL